MPNLQYTTASAHNSGGHRVNDNVKAGIVGTSLNGQ